jgi:16S rRNA (cytosine967-C5)-methyltransferase
VQLQATLDRLQLTANVTAADASDPAQWQVPTSGYDRILIDAPCSGLGVIRRHPDIKHHRRPADIDQLTQIQARLLDALWLQLKPGGRLLYMTCSVLPAENHLQIDQFVRRQKGVMLPATTHPNALQLEYGVQTLPGVHAMDGFYYCLLEKTSD